VGRGVSALTELQRPLRVLLPSAEAGAEGILVTRNEPRARRLHRTF
jgi:hypothetical protein